MRKATIEGYRLSPQQRRLWDLRREGVTALHAQSMIRVAGNLDASLLRRAVVSVARRHEALRTTFHALPGMETPIQVILEEPNIAWREIDLRESAADERLKTLSELMRSERNFEQAALEREGGVRAVAATLGENEQVLILTLPAMVGDPRTLMTLPGEVFAVCEDWRNSDAQEACAAAGDVVQYVEFSEWQNEILEEGNAAERSFWDEREGAGGEALTLPDEGTRSGDIFEEPEWEEVEIQPEIRNRAEDVGRGLGLSEEAMSLACWRILLWRFTGQPNGVVYTLVDGRRIKHLSGVLGLLAKYTPARLFIESGFLVSEVLNDAEEAIRAANKRQEFYAWADRKSSLEKRGAGAPIGFDYHLWPEACHGAGYSISLQEIFSVIDSFKLRLSLYASPGSLRARFYYDSAVFSRAFVRRLSRQFVSLFREITAKTSLPVQTIDGISEQERDALQAQATIRHRTYPVETPIELFEQWARRKPDTAAVEINDQVLSYREANRLAETVAERLRKIGVGVEARVLIMLERSLEAAIAALGVWKTGAAYIPIDIQQPRTRLAALLSDARASALISSRAAWERVAGICDAPLLLVEESVEQLRELRSDPQVRVERGSGEELAYLIYTSGTTGQAKGVMIRRASVSNLIWALEEAVYKGRDLRRVSVNAPMAFDASVKQLVQLCRGRTLIMIPEDIRSDAERMTAYIMERRVELLDTTPSQLQTLLDAGLEDVAGNFHGDLQVALIGGEAISRELWERLSTGSLEYFNVYGPTECTVDATCERVKSSAGGPILGQSLGNMQVYVLEGGHRPAPQGAFGELCVGGAGVARGYDRDQRRTAEKFTPDCLSGKAGARLYRTGDITRLTPEGTLQYAGRNDGQIKIRGRRVELGDVEAALMSYGGVRQATVTERIGPGGDKRLAAYVTIRKDLLGKGASENGLPPRYRLPNGMAVFHQSKSDTDYLYEEIFEQQVYWRHGINFHDTACVFDVGANIGMFSLFVHELCPKARIYAFEPLEPIYRTARANMELYAENVKLFNYGLSFQERIATFTYYPRHSSRSGQSEYADQGKEIEVVKQYLENQRARGIEGAGILLAEADDFLEGRFEGERRECRLRRLSDVAREEGVKRIDLLKIDVQYAEEETLAGLDEEDWGKIDQIVMEAHDAAGTATEGRVDRLRRMLEARGFKVIVEQDPLLEGTDRHSLYARRAGQEVGETERRQAEGQRRRMEERTLARKAEAALAEAGSGAGRILRDWARERLPEYMVPAWFMVIDKMPLTRNGKIDRSALPDPTESDRQDAEPHACAPARTPYEEILAGIWRQTLGVERIGSDDSFFDLGGHSLLATQLTSRVRETFGVELPLRTLFERPTLKAFGEAIEEQALARQGMRAPALTRADRSRPLPLSFAQQRLWFLDQLEPGGFRYNCPAAVRMKGRLDREALERALVEIARRHESLRTRFESIDGQPVQIIEDEPSLTLRVVDLHQVAESEREAEMLRIAREETRLPFNLGRLPLVRAMLVILSEDEHVAVFTTHHIVSDAWSIGVLVRELAILYDAFSDGRPSPLPDLTIQYADYAAWQRNWLRGEVLEKQLAYWRQRLGGELPVLKLPTDRPRPPRLSGRGNHLRFSLPEDLSESLKSLCRRNNATLFMAMLAALQTLLHRLEEQDDIIIGVDIANRNRGETENLIGFFINMLVMRVDLSDNPSFLSLLARVREIALGAYARQDVPFEKLVEELQPERSLDHSPLFRVALVIGNTPAETLKLRGLTLSPAPIDHDAVRFDLTLMISETEGVLSGYWGYSVDLFEEDTISLMRDRFVTLLRSAVANPDARLRDLDLFSDDEKRRQALGRERRHSLNNDKLKSVKRKRVSSSPEPAGATEER